MNSLKNRGSRQNSNSNTNVAQNATDVNTQSMQEGAGIFTEDGGNSAQGALLPPEYRPGARAEGVDYLDRLADTILEFDTVNYSAYTDSRGNKVPGIRFKKTFDDGTIVSFNTVSQGKRSLTVQTLFMEKADYEKRKSAKTPLMQNAPAHTPEVRVGQTSNTNVAQNATDVNTRSMQEEAGISTEDGGNSAQGALLPPEYRPGARAEGVDPNADVEGATTTPPSADADTSPYTGEARAVEDARPYGEGFEQWCRVACGAGAGG